MNKIFTYVLVSKFWIKKRLNFFALSNIFWIFVRLFKEEMIIQNKDFSCHFLLSPISVKSNDFPSSWSSPISVWQLKSLLCMINIWMIKISHPLFRPPLSEACARALRPSFFLTDACALALVPTPCLEPIPAVFFLTNWQVWKNIKIFRYKCFF